MGPGSVAVDLGCGSGHYTRELCRLTAPDGTVYAVDIQKDLLDRLAHTLADEGYSRVEVVWGDIDQRGGTKLRSACADMVVMSNVLFQLENKSGGISEAVRLLRPAGRLLVVDWTESHFGIGPDQALVVDEQAGRSIIEQSTDVVFEKEIPAGAYHWALVYQKKSAKTSRENQ